MLVHQRQVYQYNLTNLFHIPPFLIQPNRLQTKLQMNFCIERIVLSSLIFITKYIASSLLTLLWKIITINYYYSYININSKFKKSKSRSHDTFVHLNYVVSYPSLHIIEAVFLTIPRQLQTRRSWLATLTSAYRSALNVVTESWLPGGHSFVSLVGS